MEVTCERCGRQTTTGGSLCAKCRDDDRRDDDTRDVETYDCPGCGGVTSGIGVRCRHCRREDDADDAQDERELAADGGRDVSAVFTRLCELNIEAGDVPEDGSGTDRVITRKIPARHRDRDWNVALNGDTSNEQAVQDFPADGDETSVPAARAVIYLGRWPVGVLGPYGGQLMCEEDGVEIRSPEDELLRDLETELLDMGADVDRTIPDVATDGGLDLGEPECPSCDSTRFDTDGRLSCADCGHTPRAAVRQQIRDALGGDAP